jgi:hypothetical protein
MIFRLHGRRATALLAAVLAISSLAFPPRATAQFLRGFDAFREGKYCEARDAWVKSEKSGDSSSAFGLAELYARGLCVKRNERLATRWYLTAALRGNSRARAEVGMRYAYGKGVEANAYRAFVWISAGKLSASGWDTDFIAKADANRQLLEKLLSPAERERASEVLARFVKVWQLPREFNSLE